MATARDRALSDYIDAWNAGRRPRVDDFLARVDAGEREALADDLRTFLAFAPTPRYDDDALAAIGAEVPALEPLPELVAAARADAALTTAELAVGLVGELGLSADRADKTATYLDRLEHGALDPRRISRRVLDGLARVLGAARDQLIAAADLGAGPALASIAFRGDEDATEAVAPHLELLADALSAPGEGSRDEVDELFTGGR